jgi:serine protease Do
MTFLSAVSFSTAVLAAPMQDGAATAPLSAQLIEHASARTVSVMVQERVLGMGVVIDPSGLVLTPGEVAFGADGKPRTNLKCRLRSAEHSGKVVAYDASTDLALIELPERDDYAFADLADRVASTVVLVMLPSGGARAQVAMSGIPGVIAMNGRFVPLNEIRLDSGGRAVTGSPVFLPNGMLAGLISAELASEQPTSITMEPRMLQGFAAKLGPVKPATTFSPDVAILERVINGFRTNSRTVEHPWIGLFFKTGPPPELGALVTEVTRNSPAEDAGIRIGDAIVGTTSQPFRSHVDFASFLFGKKPGEQFNLSLSRAGRVLVVPVRLAREPHLTSRLVRGSGDD